MLTAHHLNGTTVGSIPYDADSMRYWRIAHDADTGQLTFLTSSDAATWTPFAATAGTDLDNVQIGLYASDFATGDGEVAFDRFNQLSQ